MSVPYAWGQKVSRLVCLCIVTAYSLGIQMQPQDTLFYACRVAYAPPDHLSLLLTYLTKIRVLQVLIMCNVSFTK